MGFAENPEREWQLRKDLNLDKQNQKLFTA